MRLKQTHLMIRVAQNICSNWDTYLSPSMCADKVAFVPKRTLASSTQQHKQQTPGQKAYKADKTGPNPTQPNPRIYTSVTAGPTLMSLLSGLLNKSLSATDHRWNRIQKHLHPQQTDGQCLACIAM